MGERRAFLRMMVAYEPEGMTLRKDGSVVIDRAISEVEA